MPGPEVLPALRLVRPVWHLRVAEPDNLFLTAFARLDFPALFFAGSLGRLVAWHSVFHGLDTHSALPVVRFVHSASSSLAPAVLGQPPYFFANQSTPFLIAVAGLR